MRWSCLLNLVIGGAWSVECGDAEKVLVKAEALLAGRLVRSRGQRNLEGRFVLEEGRGCARESIRLVGQRPDDWAGSAVLG